MLRRRQHASQRSIRTKSNLRSLPRLEFEWPANRMQAFIIVFDRDGILPYRRGLVGFSLKLIL